MRWWSTTSSACWLTTPENIGIILLGLGAGVTGIALEQPALIALGTVGGLYHLLNHSLFKSVLFLGAGSVWFRTGHRDIENSVVLARKCRLSPSPC